MAELSAAPMAKRPCQCCCQTYSEILSFLEKRSEAEQRLREEELALRREELEIQRSKICREQCRVILTWKGGKNICPCYVIGAIFGLLLSCKASLRISLNFHFTFLNLLSLMFCSDFIICFMHTLYTSFCCLTAVSVKCPWVT